MSTDWGYRCISDGATSECEINHGQHLLRSLAAAGPQIEALYAAGVEAINVTCWDDRAGYAIAFLREHGSHLLELISEYGDVEPLDKACGAVYDLLPVTCDRTAGHGSWIWHEGVHRVIEGNVVRQWARIRWMHSATEESA